MHTRLACICVLAVFLVSCLPAAEPYTTPPWAYVDLRALDGPDDVPPAHDLIALYTRAIGEELQVRLDFLDLAPEAGADITIALDYRRGGSTRLPSGANTGLEWDALLTIPASGAVEAWDRDGERIPSARLRVLRDPILDCVVASLDRSALGRIGASLSLDVLHIQAYISPPGSSEVADQIGSGGDGNQRMGRAPILIALWNVLPSTTPAQALRGWNGAHSGPFNARHGLRNLIAAVQSSRVPVVLLDMKTPQALSSLDYVGGLDKVKDLAQEGLLVLPEVLPFQAVSPDNASLPDAAIRMTGEMRMFYRETALAFGLPPSPILYAPGPVLSSIFGYAQNPGSDPFGLFERSPLLFIHSPTHGSPVGERFLSSALRWQQARILLLPARSNAPSEAGGADPERQAASDGPTLALRRVLASTAAASYDADQPYLLLGGDLSTSAWGDPVAARSTLLYLAAHPWVHPLSADDLLGLSPAGSLPAAGPYLSNPTGLQPFVPSDPQGNPIASGLTTAEIRDRLLQGLQKAPAGRTTRLAWQAAGTLLFPPDAGSPALQQLRLAALGQVGHLLAASYWAASSLSTICTPPGSSPCQTDLDWDGQEEIILANEAWFVILEMDGALLTYAFARTGGEIHQVIGPTSQFTIGLADPSLWKPDRGTAGDPRMVPGAFADLRPGFPGLLWDRYTAAQQPGGVVFTSPDGKILKEIELSSRGLRVVYRSAHELDVQIPLAIDPWVRWTPGWGGHYQGKEISGSWAWGVAGDLGVEIRTSGALTALPFNASLDAIQLPEDPNYAYPPGHYLPFPIALATVRGSGEFTIEITVQNDSHN